jgi:hypothetical protein
MTERRRCKRTVHEALSGKAKRNFSSALAKTSQSHCPPALRSHTITASTGTCGCCSKKRSVFCRVPSHSVSVSCWSTKSKRRRICAGAIGSLERIWSASACLWACFNPLRLATSSGEGISPRLRISAVKYSFSVKVATTQKEPTRLALELAARFAHLRAAIRTETAGIHRFRRLRCVCRQVEVGLLRHCFLWAV